MTQVDHSASVSRSIHRSVIFTVSLCGLMSLCGLSREARADTSELSLAFEVSGGLGLSTPEVSSSDGRWSSDPELTERHPLIFPDTLNIRVGLGVSRSQELWVRGGWGLTAPITLTTPEMWACLDPGRGEELTSGAALNQGDVGRCVRSVTSATPQRTRLELGWTWRPLDHWSPLIELGGGALYQPTVSTYERLERVGERLNLELAASGERVTLNDRWGMSARLGAGVETRVMSRWGVRAVAWINAEHIDESWSATLGITLGVSYYRYVRLL